MKKLGISIAVGVFSVGFLNACTTSSNQELINHTINSVLTTVANKNKASNNAKIQVVKNLYEDNGNVKKYATQDLDIALVHQNQYIKSENDVGYMVACVGDIRPYPVQDFPDDFNTRGNTYSIKKINGKELVQATFSEYPSMESVYYEVVCNQQTCKIDDLFMNGSNQLYSLKEYIYAECV